MISVLAFSKDRALQLDAMIRSFDPHASTDVEVSRTVLFTASSLQHERQYERLRHDYPAWRFVREANFKVDVLRHVRRGEHVLFLVDDALFVGHLALGEALSQLDSNARAVGVSLRLGRNTSYCYPAAKEQRVPPMAAAGSLCVFDWTTGDRDFGYPLEVSSSLYRTCDLIRILTLAPYDGPNLLEVYLSEARGAFSISKPLLLCFDPSVAFCAPLNRVQEVVDSRNGGMAAYSPASLSDAYERGERIDLRPLRGFVPRACHQEVPLDFCRSAQAQAPEVDARS